jgi:hypothetical protein
MSPPLASIQSIAYTVEPMNTKRRTSFTTIDLDKLGKQVGFVMIPHSPHDDAWGVTRVPIAVIPRLRVIRVLTSRRELVVLMVIYFSQTWERS